MTHAMVRRLAWLFILFLGLSTHAQTVDSSTPVDSGNSNSNSGSEQPESHVSGKEEKGPSQSDRAADTPEPGLFGRFRSPLSQQEDPDGQINTDRPTFTPANTVVPRGRLQFESGFTFNNEPTSSYRST